MIGSIAQDRKVWLAGVLLESFQFRPGVRQKLIAPTGQEIAVGIDQGRRFGCQGRVLRGKRLGSRAFVIIDGEVIQNPFHVIAKAAPLAADTSKIAVQKAISESLKQL